MKIRFVLLAAALLAWCAVDGRPRPGTTGGKQTKEDLDGIGDDLADFLKHRDQPNTNLRETQNVYSNNRNTQRPSSASDFLGDLLKNRGQGGSGFGSLSSLGGLGGLTRPSNPPSSVQYPSRPASPPPSRPASPPASAPPSRPSSGGSVPSYPNYPSYPSYPSSSVPKAPSQVPAGGGWVMPGSTKTGGSSSYPNYPSYQQPNYPSYPAYTNYQRGNPSPYPGYQQPSYPVYQQSYPGYQSVQRYDPRNPPPSQQKTTSSPSITKSVSNFFKKIFT